MGLDLFVAFTFNLALLGWCYLDSEEKMVPITRWLGLALLGLSVVGLPWYFIRSRGGIGALKAAFGFGLILLWWIPTTLSFAVCEVATGHFAE